ncbi:MAG: transposase, partial [Acetobacteraceae bacterium]|nr:transposase [Acetobacteraceae bacterium]
WVLVRDERPWGSQAPAAAFYRYSADRKGVHAKTLLADCRGLLHADGYAGFDKLYEPTSATGDPVLIEVACWSHARRKFYDVHEATKSPIAFEALQQIAALFAIEAAIRGQPPDRRAAARQEHARSKLDGLRAFLQTALARISKKFVHLAQHAAQSSYGVNAEALTASGQSRDRPDPGCAQAGGHNGQPTACRAASFNGIHQISSLGVNTLKNAYRGIRVGNDCLAQVT